MIKKIKGKMICQCLPLLKWTDLTSWMNKGNTLWPDIRWPWAWEKIKGLGRL